MASTSNELTGHCSSSSSPSWDVFLSFYGKDTRRNFIANLYFALDQAGILTFRDDPALEKGQEISSVLGSAIKNSKKLIVVLSRNYARPRWCLNELVEILNCKGTKNVVIPVFYYIDPSDLRCQKRSFGEAFESHKKHYSVDTVQKWKSALTEIGKLSGYHLKKYANENESDIIQKIVENVAAQASIRALHLEECLLGIDSAVNELYEKLKMNSNDIRAVGIYGMGGIGKTTIVKAFYNKYSSKFEISCFLENVKKNSQGTGQLLPLLQHLLIELLRRKDYMVLDVKSGIRQLKQILQSKKALIVLDDLNQSSYSEFLVSIRNLFTPGSRIIITTRDVGLVNQLKVDLSGVVGIHMVKELGEKESLKLFSYHAFRETKPPENFRGLSVKFVNFAGGLPLALKILGSSLRGRTSVSFWKAKLEKVLQIPDKEIQKVLQVSYDELDDETEKAIFLDIVFFFVGKDKDEAVHVFKSCGFFPEAGIPVLMERCLLTVDENNRFQMHNLIQDMGREVIREESKNGKCARLYLCKENVCEALLNQEGMHKIECLILDLTMWRKRHLTAKIFEKLSHLRLLEIIGASDIIGNFENSFDELRCIRWRYCPWTHLPSSFSPQKLVSLDMPFNNFNVVWKGAMSLVSLKTINVSYSMNLQTTPDFRDLKLVEKLVIRGCRSLLSVHQSIGHLTNLSHLDLGECEQLKELPEPIGQLTKLHHLDLCGCVNLKRLPKPIRQMTNLGCLNLSHCLSMTRLPEQLGDMKGLKMLDASYTAIEELPDSIAQLKQLVGLNLYKCKKLRKLPEHFGNMEGLKRFDASFSAIEQLPDSFGSLINLVELDLRCCEKLRNLPNSIWKLKLLEVLYLQGSSKLERLPEQLENMQCLEELKASFTEIEELPDSIGLLSRYQLLNLIHCQKLKHLSRSIWTLTSLAKLYLPRENAIRLNLPDSVKNMKLKSLCLRCNIRLWMPMILSFSSLKTLTLIDDGQSFFSSEPFSFSKLSNLHYLTLENCTTLGASFPELPLNLKQLEVYNHASLEQLPDLSGLKQLLNLYMRSCISLQSLPPLPPHLQLLEAQECPSLQDIPDLSLLKELESLSFVNCSNLKSISLNQSSLQVRQHFSSFRANLPNMEIAEWFSYKSSGCTLSFDIPPMLGSNFLGIALWVIYKFKRTDWYSSCMMRAIFTNKTDDTQKNYDIYAPTHRVGEVQSKIECIRGDTISVKCGDRITVSFQSLLYSPSYQGGIVSVGQVKVKMCGAHLIQKHPAAPVSVTYL